MIFITPLNYTAYLGQPDVKFHCSVTNVSRISLVWEIDGYLRPANELAARGIGVVTNHTLHESNLTISSTTENNNTRIRCAILTRIGNHLDILPSDAVIFHVQGQLANLTDSLIYYILFINLSHSVLQVYWESVITYKSSHLETITSVLHGILHQPST